MSDKLCSRCTQSVGATYFARGAIYTCTACMGKLRKAKRLRKRKIISNIKYNTTTQRR